MVSSLPPASKQTSQNLNYFKTYASELLFLHSVPIPSQSLCRDLHPPPHTAQKNCLCNSFLKQLYAVTPQFTIGYHFIHTGALYHLSMPPRCSCSPHSTMHTSITFIITLPIPRQFLHCITDSHRASVTSNKTQSEKCFQSSINRSMAIHHFSSRKI